MSVAESIEIETNGAPPCLFCNTLNRKPACYNDGLFFHRRLIDCHVLMICNSYFF
jgi:hypothetical protein